jgi:radical SAM protein with 4Fe4S-binding SPASM domain
MKHLTKMWGKFSNIEVNNTFILTNRLTLKKLNDLNEKDLPLYIGINALSGSIDIFTQKEGLILEEWIKNDTIISDIPNNDFIIKLKNRGYIFPSKEIEDLVFESIITEFKNSKYLNDKILALMAIDTSCAMRCKYCFEKRYIKHSDEFEHSVMDEKSLSDAFKALDFIKQLQKKDIEWIAGWGGEPLQKKHCEINESFIFQSKQRQLPVGFFSNLAMVDDKTFAMLKRNSNHIQFIQTTLDTPYQQHNKTRKIGNAFEKTVDAIKKLLKLGIQVRVRTNVGPDNFQYLPELADFFQKQSWFDFPNFIAFAAKLVDRYHEKKSIFTEDEAMSQWLQLQDKFPQVKKMGIFKFAPSLYNIMRALRVREATDLVDPVALTNFNDNFEVSINPIITYCSTANRAEYIFTGNPSYSIYSCGECSGLSKFKIGSYFPDLTFETDKKKKWGLDSNIKELRSIDKLEECKECPVATFCGGGCSMEAINAYGDANRVYCNDVQKIISNFLDKESVRLYKRCRLLLEMS